MSLFHLPSLVKATNEDGRMTIPWVQLFTNLFSLLNQGYPPPINGPTGVAVPQSVTHLTPPLTTGGTQGSLTFTNGILTEEKPAT